MTKTVAAPLKTHIGGDVISLASCWRVTREDGTVQRFTDHDRDILFTAPVTVGTTTIALGELYRATGSFQRTAIESAASTSVDTMDLTGLFFDGGITEANVKKGLYDNALIEVLFTNWRAPAGGIISLRKGNVGSIAIQDGIFTAEMRGLTQRLSRQHPEVYSPDCRADLFDGRCGLSAAAFTDTTLVDGVTDRRIFTVPADETMLNPEPALSSGIHHGAVLDGTLRLVRGPQENGTPQRPFLIQNSTDLDDVRDNPTAWYALDQDIDMSGFGYFTPIPNFRGGLDGRGFEILELDVDRVTAAVGVGPAALIDRLEQGAVVRRLGFRGGIFVAGDSANYAAPLAARPGSVDLAGEFGVVEDCFALGCRIETNSNRAGGLLGDVRDLAAVQRCFASCIFTGAVGALVGGIFGNGADITTQANNFTDDDRQGLAQDGTGETGTTRLTTANAQLEASFTGFDFVDTWLEPENQTAAAFVYGGSGNLIFAVTGVLTRLDSGSWITDGFEIGDRIVITGTVSNDGTYDVVDVAIAALTVVPVFVFEIVTDPDPSGVTIVATTATGKYPIHKDQVAP